MADYFLKQCIHIEKEKKNPSIYKLQLEIKKVDEASSCQICTFGRATKMYNDKVIMVLGATGSGKTTLINGMINYILGVTWHDKFRFKLINEQTNRSQAESQTSSIIAYKLFHQKGFQVPYSLTIIDTPGFGDTRGIDRDRLLIEEIRRFFSIPNDGQKPPVLEAIIASEIPCSKSKTGSPVHFKFNNSALFAHNAAHNPSHSEEEDENFDEMFWKMGTKSLQNFFTALGKLQSKSLLLTKEVLHERRQLETLVEGLQPQIQAGLTKQEELRNITTVLDQNKDKMKANENFDYETVKTVEKKEEVTSFITNCHKCHFTCHYPCGIPDDNQKYNCWAMDSNQNCRICPSHCVWNVHFNQKYKWIYETVPVKGTYKELKENYEKAIGEVMTAERIFQQLEKELSGVEHKVLELINMLSKSLLRLEEIALRPNPLSTPEYIDLLITSEKEEAKPGYQARIQSLMAVKERAVIISNIANKNTEFFSVRDETKKATEVKQSKLSLIFDNVRSWYNSK